MSDIWQRAKLRLIYLAIGLIVGLLAAGVPGAVIHKTTVREYDKRFELYATMTAQSVQTASELREENEKLRTRSTTTEKTHIDGTTEKLTTVEVDSDRSSSSQRYEYQILQLEHTIKTLQTERGKELEKTEISGALHLGLGLDQDGNKHILFSYPVWNKLRGHAWVTDAGDFGLGLGIQW